MTEDGIGIDDKDETTTPEPLARDADGIPYCKTHHVRMQQYSSGSKGSRKSYYKCPVKGCDERGIRVKSAIEVVPKSPQICPRCEVVCERDDGHSRAAYSILTCPRCNWRTGPLAIPQSVASQRRPQRPPIEAIGDR